MIGGFESIVDVASQRAGNGVCQSNLLLYCILHHSHGTGIAIACRISEITQPPIIHVLLSIESDFESLTGRTTTSTEALRQLLTEHVHACHSTLTRGMFERKCPFFSIEFQCIISASRSATIIEFISFA